MFALLLYQELEMKASLQQIYLLSVFETLLMSNIKELCKSNISNVNTVQYSSLFIYDHLKY